MSGWVVAALLALGVMLALAAIMRSVRGTLLLAGPAVLAGLAGYAWQGRPALPGHPAILAAKTRGGDTLFAEDRKHWLETVGFDALQLDGADAFIRNGDTDYAVGLLHAYLMREPNSMPLWLGLGNALQAHADGTVTPAARYAFAQAAKMAPGHPAPPYFLGLAYLQMGDADSALSIWQGLLAASPADAPWRQALTDRIDLVQRLRAPQQPL